MKNKVYSLLVGGGIGIAFAVAVILAYKNISFITSVENALVISAIACLLTLYKVIKHAIMRHFNNQEIMIELLKEAVNE